ncbi:NADH dehydrogenase subunit 6 (mitochondrion) [Ornithorhynchus anatinus]|uniref:NADH-ubiquinone oxidoreductase chain 6 n=1 Tax=Ornithorhynchus anatinus TaxID=9258 RepID=NU6M_ORNAN|nr:NADH dehydrogenase subunit 6 [Ornithorhynchus anatinus]Q36460.1 RecName: Full=NADH-ubiquinone oxidoreductase chain 6; AltName: Full=NADH dehydrogenase subunit 6 [Ornithorhynchus anatinus]CAA58453.1 NADH dehydrogenase subunit 6 [Ornithorhynchus anatinus]
MMYFVYLLSILLVLGFMAFASKPSPIYGGLSLVLSGGVGCGIVVSLGGSFLGLIVFLVYLGGMLVVFGYTAAMATEEYPETWVDSTVFTNLLIMVGMLGVIWYYFSGEVDLSINYDLLDLGGVEVLGGDYNGVSLLSACGGWELIFSGWILFLTIFVVLEVTRGEH